jgi:hypothetical protein
VTALVVFEKLKRRAFVFLFFLAWWEAGLDERMEYALREGSNPKLKS